MVLTMMLVAGMMYFITPLRVGVMFAVAAAAVLNIVLYSNPNGAACFSQARGLQYTVAMPWPFCTMRLPPY